ncbi:polyprenyl synthetase family protein [Spirochaeta isovalerica]|uniref:Octaprenyl-diphosphate synthase n=1 Tax=Spirochaeta isovalerica TaxID=150 RepID=A0A841REP6_9SPIO|nr:polyprenyl synthetase family protein [Spirochaeta isovalerica]MBB6482086.1 octaprenyl-diphosphate synthase [Spirochaeta isovalerica]
MNHYKDRLEKIEDALYRTMPEKSSRNWIEKVAGDVSEGLDEPTADRFNAPGLELLGRGGKRWRPLVMVLMAEAAGGSEEVYRLTPLVELPHNGSLIVDDIEDKSEERRGGKSVHIIHGDDISINAGNLMYFLPSYLIDESSLAPEGKFRLYSAYSRAMRRLHFGQGMDIQWHNDHDYIPTEVEYLQMTRFKTGCLSSLAANLAVIEAGGSKELEKKAGQIWEDIGVGFQILDDVMNLKKGNPGKMRGDDIVEGKKSLPMILHCEAVPESIEPMKVLFEKAAGDDESAAVEAVAEAISMIEGSGSLEKAGIMGLEVLNKAKAELKELFPGKEAVRLMIEVVDGFIEKML